VVTEDPAPGQAVTGSSAAFSVVSVSTISSDEDGFVSSAGGNLDIRLLLLSCPCIE